MGLAAAAVSGACAAKSHEPYPRRRTGSLARPGRPARSSERRSAGSGRPFPSSERRSAGSGRPFPSSERRSAGQEGHSRPRNADLQGGKAIPVLGTAFPRAEMTFRDPGSRSHWGCEEDPLPGGGMVGGACGPAGECRTHRFGVISNRPADSGRRGLRAWPDGYRQPPRESGKLQSDSRHARGGRRGVPRSPPGLRRGARRERRRRHVARPGARRVGFQAGRRAPRSRARTRSPPPRATRRRRSRRRAVPEDASNSQARDRVRPSRARRAARRQLLLAEDGNPGLLTFPATGGSREQESMKRGRGVRSAGTRASPGVRATAPPTRALDVSSPR